MAILDLRNGIPDVKAAFTITTGMGLDAHPAVVFRFDKAPPFTLVGDINGGDICAVIGNGSVVDLNQRVALLPNGSQVRISATAKGEKPEERVVGLVGSRNALDANGKCVKAMA